MMQQITTEFKNAARSVAALYKLSANTHDVMKTQGYLECLEELLVVIKAGENVQDWALRTKMELECSSGESPGEMVIPEDYSFTMSSPAGRKFPPTQPLLSVERKVRSKIALEDQAEDKTQYFQQELNPLELNDHSLKRRDVSEKAEVTKKTKRESRPDSCPPHARDNHSLEQSNRQD